MSENAFRSLIHKLVDSSWIFTFLDRYDAISYLFDVLCSPSAIKKALFFREGKCDRPEQYSLMNFANSEDFYQATLSNTLECVAVLAGDDGESESQFAVIWFPVEGLWQNLIVHLYGSGELTDSAAEVIQLFSVDAIDYCEPKSHSR